MLETRLSPLTGAPSRPQSALTRVPHIKPWLPPDDPSSAFYKKASALDRGTQGEASLFRVTEDDASPA